VSRLPDRRSADTQAWPYPRARARPPANLGSALEHLHQHLARIRTATVKRRFLTLRTRAPSRALSPCRQSRCGVWRGPNGRGPWRSGRRPMACCSLAHRARRGRAELGPNSGCYGGPGHSLRICPQAGDAPGPTDPRETAHVSLRPSSSWGGSAASNSSSAATAMRASRGVSVLQA
jgi:hypothetical protein